MVSFRHIFVPFLLTLLMSAASAWAQPATGATKVGVVNIQYAIINTVEGKREFAAVRQKFAPKQAELKRLNDEVEKLKTQLQTRGGQPGGNERAQLARDLKAKQTQLQGDYEAAQNDVQQAEQAVLNRLGQKMQQVLQKFADANGYDLILAVSNPQTPVLWVGKRIVLTQALIDAYNAEAATVTPATSVKP